MPRRKRQPFDKAVANASRKNPVNPLGRVAKFRSSCVDHNLFRTFLTFYHGNRLPSANPYPDNIARAQFVFKVKDKCAVTRDLYKDRPASTSCIIFRHEELADHRSCTRQNDAWNYMFRAKVILYRAFVKWINFFVLYRKLTKKILSTI